MDAYSTTVVSNADQARQLARTRTEESQLHQRLHYNETHRSVPKNKVGRLTIQVVGESGRR